MRPRGRPVATRGVFALEDQTLLVPRRVAWDTSFVVEALVESQPLNSVCAAFVRRLADAGTSIVVSELLEVELAEVAFRIALKERWGGNWNKHRGDGRSRRRASRLYDDVAARYGLLLSSLTHVSVPVGLLAKEAAALMTSYGLASYDAVHAATAVAVGAEAIVAIDTGYALLPASVISIYTDRSRLAACRAKRA